MVVVMIMIMHQSTLLGGKRTKFTRVTVLVAALVLPASD